MQEDSFESSQTSVSAKLIGGILQAAEKLGLDVSVARCPGQPWSTPGSPMPVTDGRVPHGQFVQLWRDLEQQTADPTIGLRLAEVTRLETFNVTGYAMSHSPTLGKALERLVRYSRLFYGGMAFELNVSGAIATLCYSAIDPKLTLPATSVDWTLANIALWANRSLGKPWEIQTLELQRPALQRDALKPPTQDVAQELEEKPGQASRHDPGPEQEKSDRAISDTIYNRVFGQIPQLNCLQNQLRFAVHWLEQPLVNTDPGLCDLLDGYAEELLHRLPQPPELLTQVRAILIEELRAQEPKLEVIAQRLNYSPRTIQRQLKQAGTSFQQLLDEVRHQLAMQYLRNPQFTNGEIAFLLGFSEHAAFNRAFRRWQGVPPGEYRMQLGTGLRSE